MTFEKSHGIIYSESETQKQHRADVKRRKERVMRKAVMTRAWEIYRELEGGDRRARLSVALKRAWEQVKRLARIDAVLAEAEALNAEAEALLAKCKAEKANVAEEIVLPSLTGSEKQIKWAEDIRAKWISEIICEIRDWEFDADISGKIGLVATEVEKLTSASWWIDNRKKFELSRVGLKFILKADGISPKSFWELD